jgi:hypothetical protein
MSFANEAGKEYHRLHETLVHKQTFDDTSGMRGLYPRSCAAC